MSMFQKALETGQIVEEIPYRAPHAVFAPLAHEPFALLLDSTSHATDSSPQSNAQWSFIAADPYETLIGQATRTSNLHKTHFLNCVTGWTTTPSPPIG